MVVPARLRIVESVPKATNYGQPGVARTPAVWQSMLASARRRIDIASFYVSNRRGEALAPILKTLAAQARAGVKIRTLPVKQLTGGIINAKYFVLDNRRTFIGSANWDWWAVDHIHEIGVPIDSPRFARSVAAVFDFDWRLAAHPTCRRPASARSSHRL